MYNIKTSLPSNRPLNQLKFLGHISGVKNDKPAYIYALHALSHFILDNFSS